MRDTGYWIASLALVAAPLAGAEPAPEAIDFVRMSDEDLYEAEKTHADSWFTDPCAIGVPLSAELFRRGRETKYRNVLNLARAVCAEQTGERQQAAEWFAQFEQAMGPAREITLGLYLDDKRDDVDAMLARFGRFADELDADTRTSFNPAALGLLARAASRHGRADQFEAILLRLFQGPGFAGLDTSTQQNVAFAALSPAIKSGDRTLIRRALAENRDPSLYAEFLALREYEAAWPLIEERVGDHYAALTGSFREWALAELAEMPSDRARFSDAAHSLHYDGRFEDAIELARSWRAQRGSLDDIEIGDGWALNIEAYALDALGRTAEADAVFDDLARLAPEGRPWLVNFVINRAARLAGQERYAEGLAAAQLARPVAEKHGSHYARMLVAYVTACSLHGLGRGPDAEADLAFLREHSATAYGMAAEAMICAGRTDEATALLLAGLAKEGSRGRTIKALLPPEYDLLSPPPPSSTPSPANGLNPRALLSSSPELQAAFARYARSIPDRFVPARSLTRK